MEIDGLEALRAEVAQLRADNRRLRRFGILGALALAAVLGVGAGLRQDSRKLETRELVLLNAGGKPCARWFAEQGDVVLELGRARDGEAPLRLRAERCRACAECVDVCPFDALSLALTSMPGHNIKMKPPNQWACAAPCGDPRQRSGYQNI